MTTAGFWLGRIAFVQRNFEKVIVLIIFLSLLPAIIEAIKGRRQKPVAAALPAAGGPQ
jgi:membrane-associated protein